MVENNRPVLNDCGVSQYAYEYVIANLRHKSAELQKKIISLNKEHYRSPKEKWYELKTKEFNYELTKNTTKLRNIKNHEDIFTSSKILF